MQECVRVGEYEACRSWDWPRAVPVMPGEAPISAATLPFNALLRGGLESQSIVFFSTPGTPWLYSGVAISNPSACRMASRSSTTLGGAPAASISALYNGIPSTRESQCVAPAVQVPSPRGGVHGYRNRGADCRQIRQR